MIPFGILAQQQQQIGGGGVVVFHDTFTDTDGVLLDAHTAEIGIPWSYRSGTQPEIRNNKLDSRGTVNELFNVGTNNFQIDYIGNNGGSQNAQGPRFRYTSADTGGYLVWFDDNITYLYGAPGNPSFSQANSGGTVRTVKIICNGTSVKVWIDGVLRFDITEVTENTNTYVGHRFYNNAYIDEIKVTTLAPLPFITGGLQIHLDAGNPASYPGSGSIWTDLSGNGRTHNIGAAAYGIDGDIKYIHYSSGTAPYISAGSYAFNTEYTITGWAKAYPTNTGTWQTLWRTTGYHPVIIDTAGTAIGGYYGGFRTYGISPIPYRDVWTMYTIVATGGSSLLYINGSYINTIGYNESGHSWTNISYSSQPFGPVATTAVYNRPLSAAEVLQNFNATKAVYGL